MKIQQHSASGVAVKVKHCTVPSAEGGALKSLHLSVCECVKQSHLSFQQGGAGSLSTRFLLSRLSRSLSSCPSVSWVNGLLLAPHNGTAAEPPILPEFSEGYFVLVAMNLICDTSAGFGIQFQKGPLVCNRSWLFTSSQLTCSATPRSLSLYPV